MTKLKVLAIATTYWKPGEDYLERIADAVKEKVSDGDFIVISEKAISTATCNIVNESSVRASLSAGMIARIWMRIVWGYPLGFLCGFRGKLLRNLRHYPVDSGCRHKQVALQHTGLLQALMFGSEGGIDGSNLAYSYVSLPLREADVVAEQIRKRLLLRIGKRVCVLIVDTDKTYSFRNFHFGSRPTTVKGIQSRGGVIAYAAGRILRLRKRATPIATAGCHPPAEEALKIAQIANHARGSGAGSTVWNMAERFDVGLTEVSWEMLETVRHKPIVIVRKKEGENAGGSSD